MIMTGKRRKVRFLLYAFQSFLIIDKNKMTVTTVKTRHSFQDEQRPAQALTINE